MLPKEELIEYVKPILKSQGFLKKRQIWTRARGEFTDYFIIQGSCFSKETYYVRPSIKVNRLHPNIEYAYGQINTDIRITTKEEILREAEEFFARWDSIEVLKEKVAEFIEGDKRNPLEKRRAGLVDYENDPVPASECFELLGNSKELILKL